MMRALQWPLQVAMLMASLAGPALAADAPQVLVISAAVEEFCNRHLGQGGG